MVTLHSDVNNAVPTDIPTLVQVLVFYHIMSSL